MLRGVGRLHGALQARTSGSHSRRLRRRRSSTAATGTRSSSARATPPAEAFAPLRHLWSLAVEEQFYLIWPLVMVAASCAAGRAPQLPRVGLWLFGVSLVDRRCVGGVLVRHGDVATTCAPGRCTATGQLFGGASASTRRCTSARSPVPAACCSAQRSRWSGGRWRSCAAGCATRPHRLDLVGLLGLAVLWLLMWRPDVVDRRHTLGHPLRPVAVPRRVLPHRPGHADGDRRRHPPAQRDGPAARQPGAQLDRARAATACTCTTGRSTRSSADRPACR